MGAHELREVDLVKNWRRGTGRGSGGFPVLGGGAALAALVSAGWFARHVTAPAVQAWQPGRGEFLRAGDLVVRTSGSGKWVFVLLHGLVASGDTFGRAFDRLADDGRLIVPDLLGFGRSMDVARTSFALDDHLCSLDAMAEALNLGDSRLVVGGHSFGALLALHWAARRRAQVDAVVTWGATLFRNKTETRERLKAMGPIERVFAQDSPLAERSCALMCRYRRAAQLLAIILSPDLPVTISRQAVLHTWPAYRGAISILFSDWETALRELHGGQVPVTLVAGSNDPSQAPDLAADLSDRFSNVRAVQIPKATHILPLTHGALCAEQLR